MQQIAFILGRIPDLAQKEIEATATILPFQWSLSMVQPDVALLKPTVPFTTDKVGENRSLSPEMLDVLGRYHQRLGGVMRIGLITDLVGRGGIEEALCGLLRSLGRDEKITYGVSVYGALKGADRLGLALKRKLKAEGKSLRYVAPDMGSNQLNTAQVFHNHLASLEAYGKAMELLVIEEKGKYYVGYTLSIQNIDFYSERDFGIPESDSRSGMLGPKVAQTMLNLAVRDEDLSKTTIYDPFCGNGRVVLEAELMGMQAFGSDIDEVKVTSASSNLRWLMEYAKRQLAEPKKERFWVQDARKPTTTETLQNKELYIVSEPYLGEPLRRPLPRAQKQAWLDELIPLYEDFFNAWQHPQSNLKPKAMLLVFPTAKVEDVSQVSLYLYLKDTIEKLGFKTELLSRYTRPDGLIIRDLVRISYSEPV